MRIARPVFLAAALAACAPVTDMAAPQTCSPRDWTSLVGTPAAAVTLPAGLEHRIYRRGGMVTSDYREDRLNIVTDVRGTIVEVSCG